MVKRKCGTCRYFDDRQIAGSGWCQHPARRELQHMVLVRKSELACRNEWDVDLWEPSGAGDPRADPQGAHVPVPTVVPVPRVSPSSVPLASSEKDPYTDKITSISVRPPDLPVPGTYTATASAATPQGSNGGVHGPVDPEESRSAVREARRRRAEARLAEQQRHQEAVARQARDLLDRAVDPQPRVERDEFTGLSGSAQRANHPPSPGVQPPISVPAGSSPHARAGHLQDRQSPARRTEYGPEASIEYPARPRRFNQTPGHSSTPGQQASVPAPQEGNTEPLPTTDVRDALRGQATVADRGNSMPAASPPQQRAGARQDVLRDSLYPSGLPEPSSARVSGDGVQTRREARPRRADIDVLPLALPEDPIDSVEALAALPRCCQTCRDFKRVGDGSQGWCGNLHAFPERRMVLADGLACRSSIGVWWLPHDDHWLEEADTTHHGRPTPLLDDLLKQRPAAR
jgi:hypothetical protein